MSSFCESLKRAPHAASSPVIQLPIENPMVNRSATTPALSSFEMKFAGRWPGLFQWTPTAPDDASLIFDVAYSPIGSIWPSYLSDL